MSQPPEGLPAEFHEDWRRSFLFDAYPGERHRAALEALAAKQNSVWELEEMVSQIESERNERGRTILELRTRLRERINFCYCLGHTNEKNQRVYCDLCRLDTAALEIASEGLKEE